jgi:preprotein translocase subunit YajC
LDPNIILFGFLAVLIVFMFRNNKKRKQQADELQASIAVGANVMLTSGIYGRVTKIEGDRLVIETMPGTSLSVIKLAVREVIKTEVESPRTKTTKTAEKPAVASATEPVKKTTVKKTAK